jgi:anaphase-promoting complex subunit 2
MYMLPIDNHIVPVLASCEEAQGQGRPETGNRHMPLGVRVSRHFSRKLQSLFVHSQDAKFLRHTLALIFRDTGQKLFQLNLSGPLTEQTPQPDPSEDPSTLISRLKALLVMLSKVGLGGDEAQRAFATAVNRLMDDFVESWHVKVDWYKKCSVMPKLRRWVEEGLLRYVTEVLSCLRDNAGLPGQRMSREQLVKRDDVKQWCDTVVVRLGMARVSNLFDYVVRWDSSIGAILDLKVNDTKIVDDMC